MLLVCALLCVCCVCSNVINVIIYYSSHDDNKAFVHTSALSKRALYDCVDAYCDLDPGELCSYVLSAS